MDAKLRIVFSPFIEAFGGVERLILALSRYLHDKNERLIVICFADTINLASYATWPVEIQQISCQRNPTGEMLALKRWHNARPFAHDGPILAFDLKGAFYAGFAFARYVVHLTDPPSFLGADISKFAPSLRGRRPDASLNGMRRVTKSLRAEAVHRANRYGMRKASAVITMTERIRNEVTSLYGVDPVVVRPGVRIPVNRVRAGMPNRALRLLTVSRLEPSKRIDWLLTALAEVDRDGRLLEGGDWQLDIVGTGGQESNLRRMTNDLGLADRVVFYGHIDDRALGDLMNSASLFLMPAAQGWGLPALEALSHGVPVIIHRSSGVSEILGGSPWVEIVDAETPAELGERIRSMILRILSQQLVQSMPPEIPDERAWAREIALVCGWN